MNIAVLHSQLQQLTNRVSRLEAENRELRRLWIENEGDIIKQTVRLDELIERLPSTPTHKPHAPLDFPGDNENDEESYY